jgi:hypothetical protein
VFLLVVLTALFAATVPGFVKTWRGESTVVELPGTACSPGPTTEGSAPRRARHARRRLPLLPVRWATLLVDGDADEAHPVSVALFLTLAGATVAAFVGVATVVLFNRPRFLVPPHLRRQWGSVRSHRAQTKRHRHRRSNDR